MMIGRWSIARRPRTPWDRLRLRIVYRERLARNANKLVAGALIVAYAIWFVSLSW